jgi:hypothetical protein
MFERPLSRSDTLRHQGECSNIPSLGRSCQSHDVSRQRHANLQATQGNSHLRGLPVDRRAVDPREAAPRVSSAGVIGAAAA